METESIAIRRPRTASLAVALVVLGCLWLAGEASAHVYWGSMGGNTVGRANSDGSGVEPGLVTGAAQPWGVAVDETHLYWANFAGHTIGRADLDGSGAEQNFIENVEPTALAVAEGHIFWTDDGPRSIGRANLDGTGVEREFIPSAGTFAGLAASSEYLYWGHPAGEGTIARAHLDGSDVEEAFVDPAGPLIPYGVAVDAGHVYWANSMNDSIGRADLSDGSIEEAFIPNAHPAGVAVDADYLYWGKASLPQAIGRANLDGSDIRSAFVPGVEEAFGLAADVAPATLSTTASPDISLGGTIHGTATIAGANAPTGTIAFALYGPGDETCTGTPLATGTAPVAGNGPYESAKFTPTRVGTYRWKAAYSGNLENNSLPGSCSGTVTVTPAPAPATTPLALTVPYFSVHIGKRERNRRAGQAKVTVGVSGAGELTLSGRHIETVALHVSAAGRAKLAISPTGTFARSLEHRATRTRMRISFTPAGGDPLVRHVRVRLAQRSQLAP
jgi:streptogramin lyase